MFEVYPSCSMCQHLVLSYGRIISHCRDTQHLVYLSDRSMVIGVFLPFAWCAWAAGNNYIQAFEFTSFGSIWEQNCSASSFHCQSLHQTGSILRMGRGTHPTPGVGTVSTRSKLDESQASRVDVLVPLSHLPIGLRHPGSVPMA